MKGGGLIHGNQISFILLHIKTEDCAVLHRQYLFAVSLSIKAKQRRMIGDRHDRVQRIVIGQKHPGRTISAIGSNRIAKSILVIIPQRPLRGISPDPHQNRRFPGAIPLPIADRRQCVVFQPQRKIQLQLSRLNQAADRSLRQIQMIQAVANFAHLRKIRSPVKKLIPLQSRTGHAGGRGHGYHPEDHGHPQYQRPHHKTVFKTVMAGAQTGYKTSRRHTDQDGKKRPAAESRGQAGQRMLLPGLDHFEAQSHAEQKHDNPHAHGGKGSGENTAPGQSGERKRHIGYHKKTSVCIEKD